MIMIGSDDEKTDPNIAGGKKRTSNPNHGGVAEKHAKLNWNDTNIF